MCASTSFFLVRDICRVYYYILLLILVVILSFEEYKFLYLEYGIILTFYVAIILFAFLAEFVFFTKDLNYHIYLHKALMFLTSIMHTQLVLYFQNAMDNPHSARYHCHRVGPFFQCSFFPIRSNTMGFVRAP